MRQSEDEKKSVTHVPGPYLWAKQQIGAANQKNRLSLQPSVIHEGEKKMNIGVVTILAVSFLMAAMAFAKDMSITVDGKPVKLQSASINHEVKESDKGNGSQVSAMACSFLFYSLLAKGDIQGAAKLSVDPAKTIEKWTKYQDRAGADLFKKNMADYFTSGNVIVAELVLADDTMLVVKTEDYTAGQFYQKRESKYLIAEAPNSETARTLGKVLTMIQEGKIKL
ncbi:MAG: hypothetical protein C0399_07725 [Syntrophus sp. (in: bacteria)]|nr:hypothetical protein [Syntrophus sp. (in: bacteria)]